MSKESEYGALSIFKIRSIANITSCDNSMFFVVIEVFVEGQV